MLKRTAIYCFFSKTGKVYSETCRQIYDLRKNTDYLIIVINGEAENAECFNIADQVVRRPNRGLDAGAYRQIILDSEFRKVIEKSDELVLCNNTFFGPFCGFKKIFDEMENKDVDFWGINIFENGVIRHIQSYFLVYRKKILKDKFFYSFFQDKIDENTTDYDEVCSWFENIFFEFLISKGYTYDCYVNNLRYKIYEYPQKCLESGLPVLKKKVFGIAYKKECAMEALKYIKYKYDYPIDGILSEIENEYGLHMTKGEVESYKISEDACPVEYPVAEKNWEQIEAFCSKSDNLYFYGTGYYANTVYNRIKNQSEVKGFVVTDSINKRSEMFEDKRVYTLGELKNKNHIDILVAMSKPNTDAVKGRLSGFRNVFDLWE